jgi:hypothetical protein
MARYNQRPDLDLSDILPSYREFLGGSSTADIKYVQPKAGDDEFETPYQEADLGWGTHAPRSLYADRLISEEPMLQGYGPETCSTSREVVSAKPAFAWDVNYYYRRLGIPFPYVNAVKGDLSRGYMAGDQHDPLAMYALKQLLDPAVRAEYDAMRLGETYLNDIHVQTWLKARAAAEAGRRTAAMRSVGEDVLVEAKDVLDEWGYKMEPGNLPDSLDSQGSLVEDEDRTRQDEHSQRWGYAYWNWRAKPWSGQRESRLEQWQSLLVRALSEDGRRVVLAVGEMGKAPHPYAVSKSGTQWVVYLHESMDPTPEMAKMAASALMAAMQKIT